MLCPPMLAFWTTASVLALMTGFWASKVNSIVPQPYLDEVFHIGQAQVYCAGNWSQWDPKITTPPGLYVVSYFLRLLYLVPGKCDTIPLRSLNSLLPLAILVLCKNILDGSSSGLSSKRRGPMTVRSIHSALNICLFPPLYFFAALYYTDVISTASVLLSYSIHTSSALFRRPMLRTFLLIASGLMSLSFRQTNIFWIAIFPAILDAVRVVEANAEITASSCKDYDYHPWRSIAQHPTIIESVKHSWTRKIVFDLPFSDTYVHDFLNIPLSIIVAVVANIGSVMAVLVPYIVLIISFGAFIIWNGSVVLGDKSNHIATLHLPQMLYLWPLITFFSLPIIYPHVVANLVPAALLPDFLRRYRPKYPFTLRKKGLPPKIVSYRRFILLFRALVIICFAGIALLAIHYNTIIHPFTLADNRHFVFYVFRLLLRYPIIKYAAGPVYIMCGWAVLQSLCKPCAPRLSGRTDTGAPARTIFLDWWWKPPQAEYWEENRLIEGSSDACRTSYVLAWLGTTMLTLVTAPLVEPRYFILPWIFWRLAVPGPCETTRKTSPSGMTYGKACLTKEKSIESFNTKADLGCGRRAENGYYPRFIMSCEANDQVVLLDHRLWLETAWFLLINGSTGYIFLFWGFYWPQEPGKTQRFMW